jgi:hypothetical protein
MQKTEAEMQVWAVGQDLAVEVVLGSYHVPSNGRRYSLQLLSSPSGNKNGRYTKAYFQEKLDD